MDVTYLCVLFTSYYFYNCLTEGLVPEYKLPFEPELGPMITSEAMHTFVVSKKARPGFPDAWRNNHPVSVFGFFKTLAEIMLIDIIRLLKEIPCSFEIYGRFCSKKKKLAHWRLFLSMKHT
jgi:hypothetical protein